MPSGVRPSGERRSWWLREALAAEAAGAPAAAAPTEAPPLRGTTTADVVVVGGGYTGLWAAFRLTELEPGRGGRPRDARGGTGSGGPSLSARPGRVGR